MQFEGVFWVFAKKRPAKTILRGHRAWRTGSKPKASLEEGMGKKVATAWYSQAARPKKQLFIIKFARFFLSKSFTKKCVLFFRNFITSVFSKKFKWKKSSSKFKHFLQFECALHFKIAFFAKMLFWWCFVEFNCVSFHFLKNYKGWHLVWSLLQYKRFQLKRRKCQNKSKKRLNIFLNELIRIKKMRLCLKIARANERLRHHSLFI